MAIIRGLKALSHGYIRNFKDISDTEENLSSSIILESAAGDVIIDVDETWPESIMLKASMSALPISPNLTIRRIENGHAFTPVNIYQSPKIDSRSIVQSSHMCCAKINVHFENSGVAYDIEKKPISFIGSQFDHFSIIFDASNVFEKDFMILDRSVTESFNSSISCSDKAVKYRFYPYGGFFKYGAHPRQMETCVFRTVQDGRSVALRISPVSELMSAGINVFYADATEHSTVTGIHAFSDSHKLSLYDELKNGACSIKVKDEISNEISEYVSETVTHISDTNLINIYFKRKTK